MFKITLTKDAANQLAALEATKREALEGLASHSELAELDEALRQLHRAIRRRAIKIWLAKGSTAKEIRLSKES